MDVIRWKRLFGRGASSAPDELAGREMSYNTNIKAVVDNNNHNYNNPDQLLCRRLSGLDGDQSDPFQRNQEEPLGHSPNIRTF